MISNQVAPTISSNHPEKEGKTPVIHYVSFISGILLVLVLMIPGFFIPQHDPLREPFYWWQLHLLTVSVFMPVYAMSIMNVCNYCANITEGKNFISYVFLLCVGLAIYGTLLMSYYGIWVLLGYVTPMPFNTYLIGPTSINSLYIFYWFRYSQVTISLFNIHSQERVPSF